jgi:hypothetical protein
MSDQRGAFDEVPPLRSGEPFGGSADGANVAGNIRDQSDRYQDLADWLESGDDHLGPASAAVLTPHTVLDEVVPMVG